MTNTRLALVAWIVPLVIAAFFGILSHLDQTLPWPEPVGEPPPCYGTPEGETICPEGEPLPPPSTARVVVSALSEEWIRVIVVGLGAVVGFGSAALALKRTRKTRQDNPTDRTAYRLAFWALIVMLIVPAVAGGLLLFALMAFRISG
ncbi:MAG: hypothetical protein JNM17_32550 [Archangium sp.]|nr:hypothetical protein [Archangium sp.]